MRRIRYRSGLVLVAAAFLGSTSMEAQVRAQNGPVTLDGGGIGGPEGAAQSPSGLYYNDDRPQADPPAGPARSRSGGPFDSSRRPSSPRGSDSGSPDTLGELLGNVRRSQQLEAERAQKVEAERERQLRLQ